MYSKTRTFSHIYLEEAVAGHPRAKRILERFPRSEVVTVDDYQNLFGRGGQDFWRQKAAPKLILARKKDNLLYAGNDFLQSNVSPNFGYNASVLNCPYDCHYCYLQGMYNSANIVAFVNLEDYFEAADTFCHSRPDSSQPVDLAISYDSDLLALEGILGYVGEWTEWARPRQDIRLEVRTKSARQRFFEETAPCDAVRLSWTLSPEEICSRYETGTPPLERRLEALQSAAQRGWPVSLCIDPVLRVPDWRSIYRTFATRLREAVPWAAIQRLEIGVFRVTPAYFKRMQRRPGTDLLHYPYEHANNAVSYNGKERLDLVNFLRAQLAETLPEDRIYLWT
jgi:spore photoproduct lyase